jgi:hypothetical protein
MRLTRGSSVVALGAILVLGVAACAPKAPRHRDAQPPPAATAHNWQYRVGQDYAYQGELSDDQRKAGQTRPSVQIYRYLGQRGGAYELRFDGETASCANPCETIYIHAGLFHVERLAFDPDTLLGAAFTDAFNGQLAVYDPAKGDDGRR